MPALLNALSPALVAAFVIWAVAALLIFVDIYHAYRGRQQEKEVYAWYARPLLWFAACSFSFGLLVAIIPLMTFPSQLFVLLLAIIILASFFLGGGIVAVVRWDIQQIAQKEEKRLRQMAESRQQEVVASKWTINPMFIGFLYMGSVAIAQPLFAFSHLFKQALEEPLLLASLVVFLMLMAGLLTLAFAGERFYKRVNHRKAALIIETWWLWWSRNTRPVYEEPLQIALPPLVLRLGRLVIPVYLMLMALLIVHFWPSTQYLSNPTFLFYLPFALFALLRGCQERVETTTRGLAVVRGILFARSRQEIPWQEVCLFVCYKSFGPFKRKSTMIYELSSSVRTVQWTRVINTRSPFTFWKPQLPPEEYSRQTEELCAFIRRMTGLQLHDLSEEARRSHKEEVILQVQKRGK